MIGIIIWVYHAEIFPIEIHARGHSLSTFTNWGLGFIIAQNLTYRSWGYRVPILLRVLRLQRRCSYMLRDLLPGDQRQDTGADGLALR